MRLEKASYALIKIGPGGRYCRCCAPPITILKRLEHRASRREEHKQIEAELAEYQSEKEETYAPHLR